MNRRVTPTSTCSATSHCCGQCAVMLCGPIDTIDPIPNKSTLISLLLSHNCLKSYSNEGTFISQYSRIKSWSCGVLLKILSANPKPQLFKDLPTTTRRYSPGWALAFTTSLHCSLFLIFSIHSWLKRNSKIFTSEVLPRKSVGVKLSRCLIN
jgi:hypothetical protein